MKHERWSIALVSFVLGFMVVTQYKMTQQNIDENIRLQRTGDLAVQLTAVQKRTRRFTQTSGIHEIARCQ